MAEIPVPWGNNADTKVKMFSDRLVMFGEVLKIRWYWMMAATRRVSEKRFLQEIPSRLQFAPIPAVAGVDSTWSRRQRV